MAFIRYSLVAPKPRQEQRVREIIDELIRFQQQQDGFIAAYRLEPDEHASRGLIGRISIWESEEKANPVAHHQHHISLQSELRLVVEETTHEEHSFRGYLPGEDGT